MSLNSPLSVAAAAVLLALASAPVAAAAESAGPSAPVSLRCEYLADPMGIDMAKPRFFWIVDRPERGQVQSAYEIVVSTDPKAAESDVWASGKIASPKSPKIIFDRKGLGSCR